MVPILALKFLHILSASLWIGTAFFWPSALRRALAAGATEIPAALATAQSGFRLDLGAGLATVATGLVYASPLNPVPVRAGILVGLTLALLRLVLLLVLARPALRRISNAAGAGDLAAARAAGKRIPAYAGTAHLLWLLALVTMVFPL